MNRPRAVDFLESEDEKEVETRNLSDEEPLVIERESHSGSERDSDRDNEHSADNNNAEAENVNTLPSGAISKGKDYKTRLL